MLIKHIRNYLGSSFSSKFIVFISAIVYSHFMSVEDFGVLNLYMSYIWIFVIIFSSNFYTAIGRYIYEEKDDFNHFFATNVMLMLMVFVFFSFLLFFYIEEFEKILNLPQKVIYVLVVTTLALILENIFTQIAIYNEQSALIFKILFLKSMAIFLFGLFLLFFVVKTNKYLGVIYAEFLIGLFFILYIILKLKDYFKIFYKKEHLTYMFNYSLPLIPYMLSLTLLSQSDRIMIDYFYSSKEVGLYSMSYNLGIVLVIVVGALINAWNPRYYKFMNDKNYKKVEEDSKSIFLISFFISLFIVLFAQDISNLILSTNYDSSLHLISIVAIGSLASAIWQIWGRITFYINKTYITSIVSLLAVMLNIGLNYYLLPLFGYEIAAWTTLVSYLFMGLLCLYISNYFIGYYKVNIIDKVFMLFLLICIYLLFEYYMNINIFIEIFLKFICICLCIFLFKKDIYRAKGILFE